MARNLGPRALGVATLALVGCAAVLGLDPGSALPDTVDADTDSGGVDASVEDHATPTHGDGSTIPTSCPAGQHLCGATCVPSDDPQYGCGAAACAPCDVPHATAGCGGTPAACAPAKCNAGWADCNALPADGCETDLSNPKTCGTCTKTCGAPLPLCDGTGCVATCVPPKVDCGGSCANTTSDPNHCGTSCTTCTPAHALPACTSGTCDRGTCDVGYADCDGNRVNGCETSLAGDKTCGSCTNDCTAPTPGHTVGLCANGTSCVAAACASGWQDCDGNLANGCECQGAGCCSTPDGGTTDSGLLDGGCLGPGAACNPASSQCCGNCAPGSALPLGLNAMCCSTKGQFCAAAADCCNSAACVGSVCQ
jgi:hypothetical protein